MSMFAEDSAESQAILADAEGSEEESAAEDFADEATSNIKRAALIAGMTAATQNCCQDIVYGILNLISAGIVAFQFYVNLQSLFLSKACGKGGSYKAADLWFYAQLLMNGTATIVQFGTWIYSGFKSCTFWWNYSTPPTSQFANMSSDGEGLRQSYMAMKMNRLGKDTEGRPFNQMTWEEQDVFEINYKDEIDELEDQFQDEKNDFRVAMKSMTTSTSLQNYLTSARAVIGALGAVVEPSLTAAAAFGGAPSQKVKALTAAGTAATTAGLASANAKNAILGGLEKCVAWRSTSTAGSAIVATIGLWQTEIQHAYSKLVMLSQIRQEKRKQKGVTPAEMERYDKALEIEIMDACGPQAQKIVGMARIMAKDDE